jgi:hypothetical protein
MGCLAQKGNVECISEKNSSFAIIAYHHRSFTLSWSDLEDLLKEQIFCAISCPDLSSSFLPFLYPFLSVCFLVFSTRSHVLYPHSTGTFFLLLMCL